MKRCRHAKRLSRNTRREAAVKAFQNTQILKSHVPLDFHSVTMQVQIKLVSVLHVMRSADQQLSWLDLRDSLQQVHTTMVTIGDRTELAQITYDALSETTGL